MTKVALLALFTALLTPVWSGPAISDSGPLISDSGPLISDSGPVISPAPLDPASARDPRFLWVAFISVSHKVCSTGNAGHPTGICYTANDCETLNGTAGDLCGNGAGSCCYFARTCDQKTITNTTSFVNPGYPDSSKAAAAECQISVDLITKNVCQLRLDFQSFDLAQPNTEGVCDTDSFSIKGSLNDAILPTLCGKNTGQHIYVNINPEGDGPVITIKTGTSDMERKWNIIVTQIECKSESEAPSGCLQYYTAPTGVIKSFNYQKPTTEDVASEQVNRHLSGHDYSVCLSSRDDSCSVSWSPDGDSSPFHFMMTGDATSSTSSIGAETASHDDCKDSIIIPNGVYGSGSGDRYCGLGFPTEVTSSSVPFLLRVKTNEDESTASVTNPDGDKSNAGFSLKYEKKKC